MQEKNSLGNHFSLKGGEVGRKRRPFSARQEQGRLARFCAGKTPTLLSPTLAYFNQPQPSTFPKIIATSTQSRQKSDWNPAGRIS